jgi:predicted ABC-type ATPase
LAQLYVDNHPGVLNLDIDQVRGLIGGWRDQFAKTGEIVRPIALTMASTHLRGGRDVVMPQYLGRVSEIERFEAAAHTGGAVFCEVILMDAKQRSVERFTRRGAGGELPWHRQVQEIVERDGGLALLADMHDQLTHVMAARPNAIVLPSTEGAIRQTYEALTAILDAQP